MKKLTTMRKLLATSLLVSAASVSQAAVVDGWDFVLDMKWDASRGATVFEDGPGRLPGRTSVGITEISWGSAAYNAGYLNAANPRSGIVITESYVTGNVGTSFEGSSVTTAEANMFTHYNSPIIEDTLKRATMDVSVQLLLPGTSDVVENFTKKFDVHFYETPNVPGRNCAWGTCENDIFAVISTMDITDTFTYGGIEYTLNYFETGDRKIEELSATACNKMGFSAGSCYGFTTPESSTTSVKFNLSVTAVPEPETYAMLLAGLGVVGVIARRRRNTIRI